MKLFYYTKKKFRRFFREMTFMMAGDRMRIKLIRSYGVKVGEDCNILSNDFSTEPFLIEIGNNVGIASNTHFITHDGSTWIIQKENPELDVFGKIIIGNNTIIGMGCYILPNTVIGNNCIIGAGSVVRGKFPDNSVIMGNPAKVVMRAKTMEKLILMNKNAMPTRLMHRKDKIAYIKKHFKM